MKTRVGKTKRRGAVIETVIHDITRVGDPIHANIFEVEGKFIVVPKDDCYPVEVRTDFSSAVNYASRLIEIEDRGNFSF